MTVIQGNNVHCWDDQQANNPDSDPAWRGDFKGLIEKLDYIKALGFSAIWITPVVTNASGYDYHGYHAFDSQLLMFVMRVTRLNIRILSMLHMKKV